MPFYTFIMDYRGGTYISQVNSSSVETACVNWANNLKVSEIEGFGKSGKEQLIEQMKTETPVLLNGLTNAWCASAFLRKGTALINIIQTENNGQLTTDN